MFYYFGYGSNMDMTSMAAKGVRPHSSARCVLRGWRLTFNVHHWFRHEGGVGNIVPSDDPGDVVLGVVHLCDDADMALLDAAEAYGFGYTRIHVSVQTEAETIQAVAYVGIPSYLDDTCLPTQRYLNILLAGATAAGIDTDYVARLRRHPVHTNEPYPPFAHPSGAYPTFSAETLARQPHYTAVHGAVFDMSGARVEHGYLKGFFGGRDTTLFHIKRLDGSDGSETIEDLRHDRLSDRQRQYLNAYLHEYADEYDYVGRFVWS